MSDERTDMELDIELTQEEEAAIERMLKETADADSAEVDFGALHDAILKKAGEEGISVFAKPRRKESRAKRVWAAVASAAAVFVVGLAVIAILRNGFGGLSKSENLTAANERPNEGDVVVTADPGDTDPHKNTPDGSGRVDETPVPLMPTLDPQVVPEATLVPTEYPRKGGGVIGYMVLDSFTVEPADSEYLIPELLPEHLFVNASETELAVTAYAKGEKSQSYKCVVTQEINRALGVGAAKYTVDADGNIEFIWRVTENCWLRVNLTGFELEEAAELLLSIPLCENAGADVAA